MFDPQLPGVFRDVLINPLPQFALPRHAIESRQLFAEFYAMHHARSGLDRLVGRRCRTAGIVGHCEGYLSENCLDTLYISDDTVTPANFLVASIKVSAL